MATAGDLLARGKVRDIYEAGDGRLLLVASDRMSAFDVILPNEIPDKGRVLTGLALFWFERTADLVGNHVLSSRRWEFPEPFARDASLSGRATLVHRADVIPVECVARGYLSGSGWRQYREHGSVCGVGLPAGLVESDRLPEPIFTPTTKAEQGHDLPITLEQTEELVGRGLARKLQELTLSVYERLAAVALEKGIVVADTKFEFGFSGGELILVDEIGTPDSSRFWPADRYVPGGPQPSFDKQFVRDWLDASGWDHEPPPPELPGEVVDQTAARYREAYERLTGERFDHFRHRMGVIDDEEWDIKNPGSTAPGP
ncbi:MAG: phosphoribosylaminoimidazolesuccinocarboxamide synthase [Actinomycetota bacterium]